ncbi:MAG: CPBP family intramembrane glutamic endopeptidase [Thermoplasmata archaeon]
MEGQGPALPNDGSAFPGARQIPPPQSFQPRGWEPPPPHNPTNDLVRTVKSILWSAGFVSFMMVLVVSFIVVLAMTPEIQNWITTPVPSSSDPAVLIHPTNTVFIITPFYTPLFTVSGLGFQAWHILMLGILFCSVVYAKFDLLRSWLSAKNAAARSLMIPEKATSSLEGVAKLFMAGMSFSIVYFIFLELINVEMGTPDFDSLSRPELIFGLFNASVWEELVSRVLLVGAPLLLIGLVRKWDKPFAKLLGGGLGFTPVTFTLILFSALIFALAHVGSWDLWKVPQVLVTGLALGWAFVRYGLHASILIHFSINLYSSITEIWPDNEYLLMLLGAAILIWMAAGGYFFLHYCIELAMKLFPSLKPKPAPMAAYPSPPPHWQYGAIQNPTRQPAQTQFPPPPPPHWQNRPTVPPPPWAYGQTPAQAPPPAYQPPPQPPPALKRGITGGFVCTQCGHTAASYDSGKLTCLRCGTAHYRDVPAKPEEKSQIEF